MSAALSLIPELEDVVQHGSRAKRTETLERVTALFLAGAESFGDRHVDLFDDVLVLLIQEIESEARAQLSNRLAPVSNAPAKVIRRLANDDDIAVAGPVLKLAPHLAEADLIDIASTKGEAHLNAISRRRTLGEAVTDVLVRRGGREVARSVAANRGARISANGFHHLVKRAEVDGILAEKVGLRPDIPAPLFRELLAKATTVVQRRLVAAANPELRAAICDILANVSAQVASRVGPRDYNAAQRLILTLNRDKRLNEMTLAAFCGEGKYEEMVAGLAALAKVPIKIADRLMSGDRPDPVLILCKAANLSWPTVKGIILARPDAGGTSSQGLDAAFDNYGRLSASTAQRVARFWQLRQGE
jgi:uncharacterized protein (DUF2336 family)